MKVLKNYLYNAGYQILALVVPLITAPYISRVLHPAGVGYNAYTNSIIQYFVLMADLGIAMYGQREIAYVRDLYTEYNKKCHKLFGKFNV